VAVASTLDRAREAFDRHAWAEAASTYAQCPPPLAAADAERFAVASYLVGDDRQCEQAWESAHRAALADGSPDEAARCAFWLGLCLMLRGQMAPASGWLARARSTIDEAGVACSASGYLLIPELLGALHGGHAEAARDLSVEAVELGTRFHDADLRALGMLGHGQALVAMGDPAGGTARLDEVMVSVTSGEVGPITSGIVYCAVVLECMTLLDLQRAAEWTTALTEWCDGQPDLVPYRGQCLVHRSQIQMASGDWPSATTAVEEACRRLTDPPHPALGLANYQQGELHRLVGAFDAAEAAYRQASGNGYDPVPGLALLELGRGDTAAATTTIRRALTEGSSAPLLAAAVDILRAAGEVGAARQAADELAAVAGGAPVPALGAMAAQALGAVKVAEGDPVAALGDLRDAFAGWQGLQVPYEVARTSVLLGLACAAVGDRAAADLELDNARATFARLGARPDLERVDALRGSPTATPDAGGLSAREQEVLTHLAAGETNREIAALLHLSQHTVGRHVENVFTKLGVSSRAAATAAAYERGLVTRR
jgi:DNA-binding CsgD family transcriptional regulator